MPRLNTVGHYWQGRYWLPLAVGLPLIASTAVPTVRRSLVAIAGAMLGVAQFGAFWTALDSYSGNPVRPGDVARWYPPGGRGIVSAMFVVGLLLLLWYVVKFSQNDEVSGASPVLVGDGSNLTCL